MCDATLCCLLNLSYRKVIFTAVPDRTPRHERDKTSSRSLASEREYGSSIDHNATDICAIADRRNEFTISQKPERRNNMDTITVKDGTKIYFKDWGTGQPLFFHHGWPLSADDWDSQMMFFLEHGYRVIAHDRRGHGRSTQTFLGHDMDTYAADVAELVEALDLKDSIHIGHSTGGGEVARYVARHGKGRVAKAVLISAIPPTFMKSDKNPDGVPKEVVDEIRKRNSIPSRAVLQRHHDSFLRIQPSWRSSL
jgi:hypothetical protein